MSNTSDRSNPKRRWHQYRLRTLLLALTLFTMALAVGSCWQTYFGTYRSEDSTMDIMIAEFFPNPNAFEGSHATNHGIIQIEHLTNLRVLDLSHNKVTGDVLEVLARMTKLEELSLNGIPIREGELQHLSHLRNLKHLSLSWTKLKTGELKQLSNLRYLEFLSMAGTSVTDDDLAVLSVFENLTTLDLSYTDVTAAVNYLSGYLKTPVVQVRSSTMYLERQT